jgi:hypothetical protein
MLYIIYRKKQHYNVKNHVMPEHLRSLVVILILSIILFALVRPTVRTLVDINDFTRRRNLWFYLTLAAFLSTNFWIYTFISILLLFHSYKRESNPPALFFFILFVLPLGTIQVPGMGVFNFLFDLSNSRIVELFILLPVFFRLIRQNGFRLLSNSWPDLAITTYLLLSAILYLRGGSLTETLRHAFYLFIDVYLPYFVISRFLTNMQLFRDALLSLVLAIMILAPLAVFEAFKHWHLYSALTDVLQLSGGKTLDYLERDYILRATVTADQPIVLGYLMAVGIGFYLFLQRFIKKKLILTVGMLILFTGLFSSLSRGPWIGAASLVLIFIATGRFAVRRLISLALVTVIVFPLISIMPGGDRVINLLPFIGKTETQNIDYRKDLLTNSMIVIQRNPWFGSVDYLSTPELQEMRQGQGIIDIVNSYIWVALNYGLIGLGLFISFFAAVLLGINRGMRFSPSRDSEEYLLGRTLLATLLAILIIIFTVSSISFIPIIYWSVAGLGVAYAQMMRKNAA